MFKSPTIPLDPVEGVLNVLAAAAKSRDRALRSFLGECRELVHGTTHAINAIITGNTAKTAFLTSLGHPDVLVIREGGRSDPFDFAVPFPIPYLPRELTFEIPGRINAGGQVLTPLDEHSVRMTARTLRDRGVQAAAVCLLWSIVNAEHEIRVGELLAEEYPDLAVTLSHRLNPTIREFRRASSAAIDASLKPLMDRYLRTLEERLRAAGFSGRVLMITSNGGVMDAKAAAQTPIAVVNSGPSMAPIAGRWFAKADEGASLAIVADTGGTTYDVSVVRRGQIPVTRDTWIGVPNRGIRVGFPWVDVKSVGAGGGSIASVDAAGLLHVGPKSAGADPGPVAYGRGGIEPTVTDAALALGYLDPEFFLGGTMTLDFAAAAAAIESNLAAPLGLSPAEAASAVLSVATENMVQAIVDITINQGIDPREAILIGGGGAAGMNSVQIARRLGCRRLLIPPVGAALSAAGALMSDLCADFTLAFPVSSIHFDFQAVNELLEKLERSCRSFVAAAGDEVLSYTIRFSCEARYATEVWEIESPLRRGQIANSADLAEFVDDFHQTHEDLFTFADRGSPVHVLTWTARAACRLADEPQPHLKQSVPPNDPLPQRSRSAFFAGYGWLKSAVVEFASTALDAGIAGPALIESPFTTVVLDPDARAVRRPSGSIAIDVFPTSRRQGSS